MEIFQMHKTERKELEAFLVDISKAANIDRHLHLERMFFGSELRLGAVEPGHFEELIAAKRIVELREDVAWLISEHSVRKEPVSKYLADVNLRLLLGHISNPKNRQRRPNSFEREKALAIYILLRQKFKYPKDAAIERVGELLECSKSSTKALLKKSKQEFENDPVMWRIESAPIERILYRYLGELTTDRYMKKLGEIGEN
jgi:hypothetical protein